MVWLRGRSTAPFSLDSEGRVRGPTLRNRRGGGVVLLDYMPTQEEGSILNPADCVTGGARLSVLKQTKRAYDLWVCSSTGRALDS